MKPMGSRASFPDGVQRTSLGLEVLPSCFFPLREHGRREGELDGTSPIVECRQRGADLPPRIALQERVKLFQADLDLGWVSPERADGRAVSQCPQSCVASGRRCVDCRRQDDVLQRGGACCHASSHLVPPTEGQNKEPAVPMGRLIRGAVVQVLLPLFRRSVPPGPFGRARWGPRSS